MPGRRDWYANLLARPDFVFHLKRGVKVDLAARAKPILDEAERHQLLQSVTAPGAGGKLERFVADSPPGGGDVSGR
jgi:hypothetical protein